MPEIKFLNRAARVNLGLKPQEELQKEIESTQQHEVGNLKVFQLISQPSKKDTGKTQNAGNLDNTFG